MRSPSTGSNRSTMTDSRPADEAEKVPSREAMFTPASDLDPVVRAETYPYLIPDTAYLFENGRWAPAEIDAAMVAGRVPVIATGSNRSPEQLARKYADFDAVTIPVERGWLSGFDVVYAAHITGYGSIAANLHPVPDMAVEVSVTWLAEDQLPRMHATEGLGAHYDYCRLRDIDLALECSGALTEAFVYVYRHGSLAVGGAPVGLSAIASRARAHAAWPQPEAIDHVWQRLGHPGPRGNFILETIASLSLRRQQEAVLQQDALPFTWLALDVVA